MEEELKNRATELSDEEMGKVAGGNSILVDAHTNYSNVHICNGGVTAQQFAQNYVGYKNVCGTACGHCPKYSAHLNLDQGTVNAIIAGLPGYERYDF